MNDIIQKNMILSTRDDELLKLVEYGKHGPAKTRFKIQELIACNIMSEDEYDRINAILIDKYYTNQL